MLLLTSLPTSTTEYFKKVIFLNAILSLLYFHRFISFIIHRDDADTLFTQFSKLNYLFEKPLHTEFPIYWFKPRTPTMARPGFNVRAKSQELNLVSHVGGRDATF